jgi:uncharacterized hydrophobic protein (TIGR00271 family)
MAATGTKIIGFIPSPDTAATVVAWVQALADEGEETIFLCYETGFDGGTERAVRQALAEEGGDALTTITIDDPMPVRAVSTHARKGNVRMLVTGPFSLPSLHGKAQTSDELVRSSPCLTFAPLFGKKDPSEVEKILFMVTGVTHDLSALRLVNTLRQRQGVHVTVGGVEDESGAKAGKRGESWIRALLHDAALDDEGFEVKVAVNDVRLQGFVELFEDQDLIIAGVEAANDLRALQQSLGEATAAIVKKESPVRFSALGDWVPRINPADHADLIYNLRQGSIWGPDFIGMLGLASAIASLGLLQNSPAVVIGSMLLAPLMTPMIGLGLSLTQANVRLMRIFGRSIGLGFLLTLAVSFLAGIITPSGATLPDEVLARGGPNVLDLLVALCAAAAATFAMARPNIAGAIAGVAIATALVPPVCAVGISLAHGAFLNAFGAATLFFTNLLAIIVMSSFTFSLLGVKASAKVAEYRRLSGWGRIGLIVLVLVIAGPLSDRLLVQLDEGKSVPLAHPVTSAVANALFERVAQDEGVEIMFLARPRAQHRVVIHIASREELPLSYANELREITRKEMDNPDLPVTVVAVRGLWRSDSDDENLSP